VYYFSFLNLYGMIPRQLEQKHLKERISLERAKEKAWKQLREKQAAVLSIFEQGEKIPASIQQRIQNEIEKFKKEWSEEGPHFSALVKKQKREREKLFQKNK